MAHTVCTVCATCASCSSCAPCTPCATCAHHARPVLRAHHARRARHARRAPRAWCITCAACALYVLCAPCAPYAPCSLSASSWWVPRPIMVDSMPHSEVSAPLAVAASRHWHGLEAATSISLVLSHATVFCSLKSVEARLYHGSKDINTLLHTNMAEGK